MGAPLGNIGGGTSSPGNLRDRQKKALETERLFAWGSERGTWGGGAPLLGTLKDM
jgi:hypothetical protein